MIVQDGGAIMTSRGVLCFTLWILSTSVYLPGCAFLFGGGKLRPSPTFQHAKVKDQSEYAVLENRWGCPYCVEKIWEEGAAHTVYDRERDGLASEFLLAEGKYKILYTWKPYKVSEVKRQDTVKLQMGRTYRVEGKAVYGFFGLSNYTATTWIEDRSNGNVVAGEKW
jgi:hypothetical protein